MSKVVRILVVGDIVGNAGKEAVLNLYPKLKKEKGIDFCIVNAENIATKGSGVKDKDLQDLLDAGIDVITGGDHMGKHRGDSDYIMQGERLLRPANYTKDPGKSSLVCSPKEHKDIKIGVLNVIGNVFMEKTIPAFKITQEKIEKLKLVTDIIIVDFHAEASSEKVAMGLFLDGKVSAVFGTHTHVQTADEKVLPNGTAYITDLGMTGGMSGVIGRKKESVILKFLNQPHSKFEVTTDDVWLNGALIDIETSEGKATHIERVSEPFSI
ncbi:hypothetical protein AB834_02625 [PVC group bacterium (ex Bugula neritina AB1)]|nr:hypothetical protein AB834_02625 [PVC group bacterium (ex Bugula neritina AB1)]